MGLVLAELNRLNASQIYLDTNIFIYALEGIHPYAEELRVIFESIDSGSITAVTSELSLAECLVKPFADDNMASQAIFNQTLSTSDTFQIIPISRQILVEAARLKATYSSLRLPDAIHLATADICQCTIFLTNDNRLKVVSKFQMLLLKDFI